MDVNQEPLEHRVIRVLGAQLAQAQVDSLAFANSRVAALSRPWTSWPSGRNEMLGVVQNWSPPPGMTAVPGDFIGRLMALLR